jgi:hypothetical protein
MEKQHQPGFNRTSLQHKFVDWRVKAKESGGPDFFSYDDEITVNTQAGGQRATKDITCNAMLIMDRKPMGWA